MVQISYPWLPCSRSCREEFIGCHIASPSAKIIVPVLVRPTRVLDEGEGDSPIPPKLYSEDEGSGELGFHSKNLGGRSQLGLNKIKLVIVGDNLCQTHFIVDVHSR